MPEKEEQQPEKRERGGVPWWNPFGWFVNAARGENAFPTMMLIGTMIMVGLAFFGDKISGLLDGLMSKFNGNDKDSPQADPSANAVSEQRSAASVERANDITLVSNTSQDVLVGTRTAPEGKNNLIMVEVGHGGRVETADGTELTQEQYDALTLPQFTAGVKSGQLRIVTDGYAAGAVYDDVTEYEANLYHAIATGDKLRAQGWETTLFASGDDGKVEPGQDLQARVDFANKHDVAMMISFHNNAGGGQGSEVFHANDSVQGKALAQSINQGLEQSGLSTRGAKSEKETYATRLRILHDHDDAERPVVLMEGLFMDHEEDKKHLFDPAFIDRYSSSIATSVGSHAQSLGYAYDAPIKANDTILAESAVDNTVALAPSDVPNMANDPLAARGVVS